MRHSGSTGYRPDVHALRAIAVLAVVAFHMGVPGVNGGFVGVDVFFVLSGFLITGQLVGEHTRNGRIAYSAFFARRVRRLLPLSALVLLCTLVAASLLLSPFDLSDIAEDVGWAGGYLANFRFVLAGEDYFAISPSPVTHYWSLAVEEQFYVVWPFLLALLLVRRRWLRSAVLLLFVASFVHSMVESSQHPSFAYYSSSTRAWQLLAGSLVAVSLPHGLTRVSERTRTAAALGGVAIVVVSVGLIDERYTYPGLVALVPVLGTTIVLAAAPGMGSPLSWLMTLAPVRLLGDLSYGWYLWHWPAIIFAERLIADDGRVRVVMGACSLALAWVTYRMVEEPLRRGQLLRRPRRAAAVAGISGLVIVAASVGVVTANEDRLDQPRLAEIGQALSGTSLAGPDCFTPDVEMLLQECRGGTVGGPRLVLAGDSNARMWFSAFTELGEQRGFEVVLYSGNGCNVLGFESEVLKDDCETYSKGLAQTFRELDAAAVVVTHAAGNRRTEFGQEWLRRLRLFVEARQQEGSTVGSIDNVPSADFNVRDCLVDHSDSSVCDLDAAKALQRPARWHDFQTGVMDELGVVQMDPSSFMCRPTVCPVRSTNGVIALRDSDHVTIDYAARAAPYFEPFVAELLHLSTDVPGEGQRRPSAR